MKQWLLFFAIAIAVSIWTFLSEKRGTGQYGVFTPSMSERAAEPLNRLMRKNQRATPPQKRAASMPVVVSGSTPLEVTQNYLVAHQEEFKIQKYHQLKAEEFRTPLGSSVRYRVSQDGLPIVGVSIDFRLDRKLRITAIENEYRFLEKANVNEVVLPTRKILTETESFYGLKASGSALEIGKVLYVHPASPTPTVAYALPMKEKKDKARGVLVLVRASDGQMLAKTFSRQF